MNGTKYFFNTNAIIGIFKGEAGLRQYLLQEKKIQFSVVSVIEFLSFQFLTESEKEIFLEFCKKSVVIDLFFDNSPLIDTITLLGKKYKLKLPDAIIAASSIVTKSVLVTNDLHFTNVANLQILTF